MHEKYLFLLIIYLYCTFVRLKVKCMHTMEAFLIFVAADMKLCFQDKIVIRSLANSFKEASEPQSKSKKTSKDGCGLRYWTGSSLDPSPLFPVYMTIP